MDVEIIEADRKEDERGWLLKILQRGRIQGQAEFGELYLSAARPGRVRGGHYHEQTTEWFCLLQGSGTLSLADVDTRERRDLALRADTPQTVRIGPRVAHAIRCEGEEACLLLAYADRAYDPEEPDTVPWPF